MNYRIIKKDHSTIDCFAWIKRHQDIVPCDSCKTTRYDINSPLGYDLYDSQDSILNHTTMVPFILETEILKIEIL